MNLAECCEMIQQGHPRLCYCERFDQNSDKWDFTRHSHPYIELIFFLSGKLGLSVAGENLDVAMYDVVVYPANAEHQDGKNLIENCEIICFWVDLPQLVLDTPIHVHDRNHYLRDMFLFIYELPVYYNQ